MPIVAARRAIERIPNRDASRQIAKLHDLLNEIERPADRSKLESVRAPDEKRALVRVVGSHRFLADIKRVYNTSRNVEARKRKPRAASIPSEDGETR